MAVQVKKITYGGKPNVALNGMLDELAQDIAMGSGALSHSLQAFKYKTPTKPISMI